MPEQLFGKREDVTVCYHCDAPAEVDPERCKPGEIAYKPCGVCGESGIRRQGDLYQELHRKKTNTAPYDKSPYRGGRL